MKIRLGNIRQFSGSVSESVAEAEVFVFCLIVEARKHADYQFRAHTPQDYLKAVLLMDEQ